ncbi:MAG TPA: hypothetical protein VMA53_28635 [Stellaceae bacterium]|nr:hypothetical protein [Stellaceae bacterium]
MTAAYAQHALRCAAFSAALLLAAAPVALADPPGYDFMDFNQAPTMTASAPAQPQPQTAPMQEATCAAPAAPSATR